MTNGHIIQDLISILDETSPRGREVIERAIKEIEDGRTEHLPDAAAIDALKEVVTEKDAIIEEQDQRFVSFFKFCVEALEDTCEALEAIRPGKETRAFITETKEKVETATPEGRPFAIVGRIRIAIEMMKETPPISMETETEKPFTYSTRGRNENRALAIIDHQKRTGRKSSTRKEITGLLEGIEGARLDRTVVLRAMERAKEMTRGMMDLVGGVARLVLPDPKDRNEGGDGGDTLSRPRGPRIPWNG